MPQSFIARAPQAFDPLDNESRQIERRRQFLEERRQRVLQAKNRLIGVDVEDLNAQVEQKQRDEQERRAEDELYHLRTLNHLHQMQQSNAIKAENEAANRQALAFYHQTQAAIKVAQDNLQKVQERQKPEEAARFLQFAGEDQEYEERVADQKKQQRQWSTQQIAAKMMLESKDREEEREREEAHQLIVQRQRLDNQKRAVEQARAHAETTSFNASQVAANLAKIERHKQHEREVEEKELISTFNSAFLREDSHSRDGNSGCYFKGFTQAAKQSILDKQRDQQNEAARRSSAQLQADREYDDLQASFRREQTLQDLKRQEIERTRKEALAYEHKRQVVEKCERDRNTDMVYANKVDESWFDQFGKSAR